MSPAPRLPHILTDCARFSARAQLVYGRVHLLLLLLHRVLCMGYCAIRLQISFDCAKHRAMIRPVSAPGNLARFVHPTRFSACAPTGQGRKIAY